jgi:hypothetical protein
MCGTLTLRNRRALLSVTAALAVAFGGLPFTAAPAQAWPNSGTVQLTGTVTCGSLGSGYNPIAVQASAGGQTVRTRVRTAVPIGYYRLPPFTNIPKNGTRASVTISCAGPFGARDSGTFSIKVERPLFGTVDIRRLVIP